MKKKAKMQKSKGKKGQTTKKGTQVMMNDTSRMHLKTKMDAEIPKMKRPGTQKNEKPTYLMLAKGPRPVNKIATTIKNACWEKPKTASTVKKADEETDNATRML